MPWDRPRRSGTHAAVCVIRVCTGGEVAARLWRARGSWTDQPMLVRCALSVWTRALSMKSRMRRMTRINGSAHTPCCTPAVFSETR